MGEEANSTSTQEAAEKLDAVACIKCGYALKGLDPSAACPECGVPIEHSIGPWLLHAPTQNLQRLHSGLSVVGAFCILLGTCWGLMLCMLPPGLGWYLAIVMLLMAIDTGCWRSTSEIQNLPHGDGLARWRELARLCSLALGIVLVASFGALASTAAFVQARSRMVDGLLLAALMMSVSGLMWSFGGYLQAFSSAMRADGAAMASRAAQVVGVLLLLAWLPGVIEAFSPGVWNTSQNSVLSLFELVMLTVEWLSVMAALVALAVMSGKVSAAIGQELQRRPEARSGRAPTQTGGDRWLYP